MNSDQNYNSAMQNGSINDDPSESSEALPEHWQQQVRLANELRLSNPGPHRHCKKGGATLTTKGSSQLSTEHSLRDWEQIERDQTTNGNLGPRQDWDGMDMSGQGLKCLSIRLFTDYTFLTKLFIDNNKLAVLPPMISSLRNLTHLQASSNGLHELPDTIGMLSKLEQLLVFDNKIRVLPAEIGFLFRLEMLGIDGNPLDEQTKEFLIQNGTQSLVVHLRDSIEGK